MYDLREHKELISQLVSEANQNDENWRWSVKSVGGDGCWITAKNEHGETMNSEIVEDKELPYLNCPLDKAIEKMVRCIINTAHACY
jgi:hypothetical protein